MSARAVSIVGSAIDATRLGGPPASTIARFAEPDGGVRDPCARTGGR